MLNNITEFKYPRGGYIARIRIIENLYIEGVCTDYDCYFGVLFYAGEKEDENGNPNDIVVDYVGSRMKIPQEGVIQFVRNCTRSTLFRPKQEEYSTEVFREIQDAFDKYVEMG